jgi:HlyD family secretion protein
VSEADIGGVAVGQNVNFTVDAYPYRTFHGEVNQIRYGPVTNQNVVSYDAVISVSNKDLKLLPGMTASVSIIVAQQEDVLKVPNAALRFRPPEVIVAETRTNALAQNGSAGGRGGAGQGGPGGGSPAGAARAAGGAGGPRGGSGVSGGGHVAARTVYTLIPAQDNNHEKLNPVKVRTGINDGVSTEILEGLKEGDLVVTGILLQDTDSGQPSNPFGGGRRRF